MKKTIHYNRGLTLVELLVSISIFVLITSVTMTNYPRFSNKLSLDLLAEDVALSLRQAQIFGSSVLGAKRSLDGQTRTFGAYGVHFEVPGPLNSADRYTYLLFADIKDGNSGARRYDGPTVSSDLLCPGPTLFPVVNECLQKFLVSGKNKIKLLCKNFEEAEASQRVKVCDEDKSKQIAWLDILFVRPNLDAEFTIGNDNINLVKGSGLSNVGIVLESLGGEYNKTIVVWKTGQISVE